MLNPVFSAIYITLGAIVLAVEFYGIHRQRRGDTISEHWWWLQRHAPILSRLMLGAFLTWLAYHLFIH